MIHAAGVAVGCSWLQLAAVGCGWLCTVVLGMIEGRPTHRVVAAVCMTNSSGRSASSLRRRGVAPDACSQSLELLSVLSRCNKCPPPRRIRLCVELHSSMTVVQCCSLKTCRSARLDFATESNALTTDRRTVEALLSALRPCPPPAITPPSTTPLVLELAPRVGLPLLVSPPLAAARAWRCVSDPSALAVITAVRRWAWSSRMRRPPTDGSTNVRLKVCSFDAFDESSRMMRRTDANSSRSSSTL